MNYIELIVCTCIIAALSITMVSHAKDITEKLNAKLDASGHVSASEFMPIPEDWDAICWATSKQIAEQFTD